MKLKKILSLLLMISLLCACTTTPEEEYVRSSKEGKITNITLAEMEEKIANKETFPIVFTTNYCNYCKVFHQIFDEYIKTHEVVMYQVILDNEVTSEQENLRIIHQYFEEFSTTPGIFFVKEGEKQSYLDTYRLGISEEVVEEWVIENKLDQTNK